MRENTDIMQKKWEIFMGDVNEHAHKINIKRRRDVAMFREELDDLHKLYQKECEQISDDVNYMMPRFLQYMEEFLELHKKNDVLQEKIEILKRKIDAINPDDKDE